MRPVYCPPLCHPSVHAHASILSKNFLPVGEHRPEHSMTLFLHRGVEEVVHEELDSAVDEVHTASEGAGAVVAIHKIVAVVGGDAAACVSVHKTSRKTMAFETHSFSLYSS